MPFPPSTRVYSKIAPSCFAPLLIFGSMGLFLGVSQCSKAFAAPLSNSSLSTARLTPIQNELSFYQQRIQGTPDAFTYAALASTYFKMAKVTEQSHWYLKADNAAQTSLDLLPHNNLEAVLIRARVAEARHDFPKAIALANRVLTDMPGHENALSLLVTSYLGQGNLVEADRVSKRLVAQLPTIAAYTLRAQVAIAQGKDEEAIANFQLALEAEEVGDLASSEKLRLLWAKYAESRGQLSQSRTLLESALKYAPQSQSILLELAHLDKREGHYQAAAQRYDQLFQLEQASHSHNHAIAAEKAELFALMGNQRAAERLWAEAEHDLRHHGDLATFGHQREFAQLLLQRGTQSDISQALILMKSEITRRQDHETRDTLAWALSKNNQTEEALSTLQAAIEAGTKTPLIFYRAAAIAKNLQKHDLATQYQNAAQSLDPTLPKAMLALWGVSSD